MLRFLLSLLAVMLATPATAQDLPSQQRADALGGLRPLANADDAQPWTGIGRLDTGISFCTATLISDRMALTAAHCIHDMETGERIDDAALTFLAGLRNGRPETLRRVRRSYVPDAYVPTREPELEGIGHDLALLHLDLPIRSSRIAPIPPGRGAAPRSEVTVVSYGRDREAVASIEEGCLVLQGEGAVRLLSCEVDQGSSGAPVMRITPEGPELVAVISASARDDEGRALSMAATLDGALAMLLDRADRGAGQPGRSVRLTTPTEDGGRSGLGARFIRP